MKLSDTPLMVMGDAERLASALDNLLQNAVKFSSGPPEILVVGDRRNGRARLVIKDHGIGIPREARPHLFEKFYRVNNPELQNVTGTGIGLYLVRQVVESQPGEGSEFKIELPVAQD